jgi:hypothetical protein
MRKSWTVAAYLASAAVFGGCAAESQQQMLAAQQPSAVASALQRGRFDLGCPEATATVLSSDFIQPVLQGPFVEGIERVEYTVGVAGCNQRRTYIVICQQGSATCFSADPRNPPQ